MKILAFTALALLAIHIICGSEISIEQAISDNAQQKTIAFSCLAFLTGDMCSSTFFPPGKVSDFFGFQYMRDIIPNGYGHNTEFAGRAAASVLSILSQDQVQALVNLANNQADTVDAYGYKRFVLIKAFQRLLDNDLPSGTNGLDIDAVTQFTGDLYAIDSEISYDRAQVIGAIIEELSDTQKTDLWSLREEFFSLFAASSGTIPEEDWPAAGNVDMSGLNNQDDHVLVGTYASQLFSWFTGNVTSDTYFCPERHGTYFGSFYMKDIPPVKSTSAVTIDTELTANLGAEFLAELDPVQQELVTSIVDLQRENLNNIVVTRENVSEMLRSFMVGQNVNEGDVLMLVRHYGELEGDMMYYYATNFAAVGHSLNSSQQSALDALRIGYYQRFPEYQANSSAYICSGAWLYADQLQEMPNIINTDFLFTMVTTPVTTTTSEATTVAMGCSGFTVQDNMKVKAGTQVGAEHTVDSIASCCSLCTGESSCTSFFYEAAPRNECKLFSEVIEIGNKMDAYLGTAIGGASSAATTTQQQTTGGLSCSGFIVEDDMKVKSGTPVGPPHTVDSVENCCSLCVAESSCARFFYEAQPSSECKMFSEVSEIGSKNGASLGTRQ